MDHLHCESLAVEGSEIVESVAIEPVRRPWVVVLWSKRTLDNGRTASLTVVVVMGGTWRAEGRELVTPGGETVSRAMSTVGLYHWGSVSPFAGLVSCEGTRRPQRVRFPS